MQFYKVILNGFNAIERTRFVTETDTYQVQIGNNSKLFILELWFVHFACHPVLVNISVKFREDILNGFQVTERT